LENSQSENNDDDGSVEHKTVFSYDTQESGPITWDPKLGVNSSSMLVAINMLLAAILIFAL